MNTAIKTPGGFFKEISGRISAPVKAAFWGAVVVGLMTHLYQFTNKLYNYDELYNTPNGYGIGAELGRWMLKLLGDFLAVQFGNYSLPLVNGMISVLFLALSAALIAAMFQLSDKLLGVLIGGLFLSFPSVISTFAFMYTAAFYAFAVFLCTLAAYLTVRFTKNLIGNVISVVAIACSMGIYQAYFCNTVCLFVMSVILLCAFTKEEKTWKDIFFTALRYLLVLILGLILYLVLNKFFVAHWGVEMSGYQGADTMGQTTLAAVLTGLKGCYRDFIKLVYNNVMYLNPTQYVRRCYLIQMIVWIIGVISLLFGEKGCAVKKTFMVLGFAIFPVALYLIYLMVPNGWVYTLMAYSVVFVSIFTLLWADRYEVSFDTKKILQGATQWMAVLTSILMIAIYVWYGNGCYMALEYTKYHDLSYFQTMVTQIKSIEGYQDELPVAMIGNTITDETNNMGSMVTATFGLDGKIDSNINAYSRDFIMTKYLGFAPRFCGYEEIKELMENEEVQAMPCYPDSGSIQIVDGVIVVKLSE